MAWELECCSPCRLGDHTRSQPPNPLRLPSAWLLHHDSWGLLVESKCCQRSSTSCTASGTRDPSLPASWGWGPEWQTCTLFAAKQEFSQICEGTFRIWTHPCLPCAHPPLVKPVTDCHGANEAGEDDGGIQNLSRRFWRTSFKQKCFWRIPTCLAGILRKLMGA